jgi:hypothetical protein
MKRLMTHSLRWLGLALLAGMLASCGGGQESSATSATPLKLRQQDAVVDAALCAAAPSSTDMAYTQVSSQCLRSYTGLASRLAQARQLASAAPFTASTLMDWAQATFPQLFPGAPADQAGSGFVYRYYPLTQTFIAVAGDLVYVLGPITGNQLAYLGTLTGFSCSVYPGTCAATNNVQTLTVDPGPSGSDVNVLYTDVTICIPGSTTQCQTIDHVIVDTGSTGLRILASVLSPNLNLPLMAASSSQTLANCAQFVDNTFLWGPMTTADVAMAGEKAASVPIQIVGDARVGSAPRACSNGGSATNTPETFGANGIIGLSVFKEDCGPGCASTTSNGFYYACAGSTCVNSKAALAQQLKNPITFFAADNNGVIINLPAVAQAGAASVTGTMIFGIGTQSNNQVTSETVLTLDSSGDFTTVLAGKTMPNSFIDSGSNGIFFDPGGIAICSNASAAPGFYCPATRQTLQAVNTGSNGVSSTVSFSVDNASNLVSNSSNSAFAGLAGPMGDSTSMDWGLSFFYGRRVITAIETQSTPKGTGPWVAY